MKSVELSVIEKLIEYWGSNGEKGIQKEVINRVMSEKKIVLPDDFQELYSKVNGMKDQDDEAFTFFCLEDLCKTSEKFNLEPNSSFDNIIIFVDYMIDCWWYGFRMKLDGSYEIGILPGPNMFTKITDSLGEFIILYLADSPLLYRY